MHRPSGFVCKLFRGKELEENDEDRNPDRESAGEEVAFVHGGWVRLSPSSSQWLASNLEMPVTRDHFEGLEAEGSTP
jgi:hypothetical protein